MKNYWWVIFLILGALVYSFLLGALITWLFCLAFGFTFTWARAAVVWLVCSLLTGGISIKIRR